MTANLKQKISLSLLSFISGGIVTYFVTDYVRLKSAQSTNLKPITKSDVLRPKHLKSLTPIDPFDQIDQLQAQMRKRMNGFFNQDDFGFNNNVEVNQYEDDEFKKIEITAEGVDKDSLKININEGMVSISGEIQKENEDENGFGLSKSRYVSKFNQSFNVPEGVDESRVKIETENNKLIIKFPKV